MMVIQEIQRFPNYVDTSAIAESMNGRIDKGWRVHSCLVRGAEVIIVYERNEEARDSIICLEKACDELKAALKKKDAELKAVRHYFNECVEDLKKAHAEIEILKRNPPRFILTDDESFESLEEKIKELNPLVMSSDNASIVCIDADKIKAEAIKELMFNLDNEISTYSSAGKDLNVYAWLKNYAKVKVGE